MYTFRASSLSLSSPMGWRQSVWWTAAAAAAAAKLITASYRPSDWFLRRRDGSDDSDSSHERDRCPLWPCRFYTYPMDRRRRQYALRHPLLCNSSSVRRPADWVKNDLLKIPLPQENLLKGWELLIKILHACLAFSSTLNDVGLILFSCLQLWQSYAILRATVHFWVC